VRIRPLSSEEAIHEPVLCLDTIPEGSQVNFHCLINCATLVSTSPLYHLLFRQIVAGNDTFFTFDHVFGVETQQSKIYEECVTDLVDGKQSHRPALADETEMKPTASTMLHIILTQHFSKDSMQLF